MTHLLTYSLTCEGGVESSAYFSLSSLWISSTAEFSLSTPSRERMYCGAEASSLFGLG